MTSLPPSSRASCSRADRLGSVHLTCIIHMCHLLVASFLIACGLGCRCVVRNPWDRLVSDWRWRRKSSLPLGQLSFPDFARFVVKLVVPKGEKEEDPLSKSSSKGLPASWDAAVPKKQFAEQYLGHFKAQVFGGGFRVSHWRTVLFFFLLEASESMTYAS